MKGNKIVKEYYEFATDLRKLLRRADRFGFDIQRLKEEVTTLKEELDLLQMEVKDAEKWTDANGFSYTIDEED